MAKPTSKKKSGSVQELSENFSDGYSENVNQLNTDFTTQSTTNSHGLKGGFSVESIVSPDSFGISDDFIEALEELQSQLGGASAFRAFGVSSSLVETDQTSVVGTGIGLATKSNFTNSELTLKVFVDSFQQSSISTDMLGIEGNVRGKTVEVESIEEIRTLQGNPFRTRHSRPVPCGISIGNYDACMRRGIQDAGTLGGVLVRSNGNLCILSNNHVLADSNGGRKGVDRIIQQGLLDGGRTPEQDGIAILEDYVELRSSGNLVDAAVAFTASRYVNPEFVTYTLDPRPIAPQLGMLVGKNGRTTGGTLGIIHDIVSIPVSNPYLGTLGFSNQLLIRPANPNSTFSAAGDSGSLIVAASSKRPVALLFAGNGQVTLANPIGTVMSELNIDRFLGEY
ncbi:hypothetical protein [Rubinisphaera sp.]|uniref:hypothetical protein n=1 Tax=Rubinisphaera sp. TaxID=2024857 RepID=UPI000C0D61B7|nr:hypothetical protein [Rubinisphaera sp.]MBV08794.1 hypothetical protein [Rubinisphaera sp.]HCS52391.1 hypothetical protein [Planctomycetaceae bacterium]|tara:strand:+ start:227 stop:1411 length:1185 start_codon:yes stop_codon:yes gene_type:complete